VNGDPCSACPLNDGKRQKVPPFIPTQPLLGVVGLGSGLDEQSVLTPFVGEGGRYLRRGLCEVGLPAGRAEAPRSPDIHVAYLNLTRCRPDKGDFESREWKQAAARCWRYLDIDVAGGYPLLLLGSGPLRAFTGNAKASILHQRGLWLTLPGGRQAFAARHPAAFFKVEGAVRKQLESQFLIDLRRMADRVLGRETFPPVDARVFRLGTPQAGAALGRLAENPDPWFFDVETFDAKGSPARAGVATDPFHPDFRVRGVAVALDGGRGFWVEFDQDMGRAEARRLLDPAFGSGAEKGAFVSGFDSNGLIAQGWVSEVRNLARDPWLAAIALDTRGGGHSLERLVVDVLGEPQPKAGVDRARIAEMPLEAVARYAVNDACCEFRLDAALRERLARGEYL
jgi:uracil-DNA glycosylase